MSGPSILALVVVLVLSGVVSGRLVAGLLGPSVLRRFTPESAAASLLVGVMVWTVGFGWLTWAGVTAPVIFWSLCGVHLVALVVSWWRGSLACLRPCGRARTWLLLLAAGGTLAGFALLPVLRTNGFAIDNDTWFYCAFSEWLQTSGFGIPTGFDPQAPVTVVPSIWQETFSTMGAGYTLALVQAASSKSTPVVVYPAVSTLGLLLTAAALFVAARWVLRLGSLAAVFAVFLFALLPGPSYWAHHNGFLQQTHGLPSIVLAAVLTTRVLHRKQWSRSSAFLIGLAVAYQASVYVAALPALAAILLAYLLALVPHARRHALWRQWMPFAGATLLVVALFAHRDGIRAVQCLPLMAGSVPGWHIPFTPLGFLQFAFGFHVYSPEWADGVAEWLRSVYRGVAPIALGLAAVGIWGALRRRRTWPLLFVLLLYLGSLALFAVVVRDPWTGELGHTWSIFKLTQWAYPLVVLFVVSGLVWLLRGRRTAWAIVTAVVMLASPGWARLHWAWAGQLGSSMKLLIQSARPLEELPRIRQRVQELPSGLFVLLGRPNTQRPFLGSYTALLAFPRPIIGDWKGIAHIPERGWRRQTNAYVERLRQMEREHVVPILAGFTAFHPAPVEDLGGGFAWLREPVPLVVSVSNPNGVGKHALTGRPFFWMGKGRTTIVLFSPRPGPADLLLEVRPGPSRPGTDHRTVDVHLPGGVTRRVEIDTYPDWRLALDLAAGISEIELEVRDQPTVSALGGDRRPLLMGVSSLELVIR